jgi:hypothetical protein
VLGLWIVYATLHLHFTAVSFARRSLADHGFTGARRRLIFLGITATIVTVAGVGAWVAVPHLFQAVKGGTNVRDAIFEEVLRTPAMAALLWAPKALVGPAVAGHLTDFATRLPAALAILGLHYVWVISSDAAFEEVAAEAAEKRAAKARAAGVGGRGPQPQTPTARSFVRLSPRGSPVTALAWSNLAAIVRLGVSVRFLIVSLMIVVSALLTVSTGHNRGAAGAVAGTAFLMFAGCVVALGPLLLRFDLRRDLLMLDVLKTYPLRGAEIVAGELLAPLCVLGALACTLQVAGLVALETGTTGDAVGTARPILLALLVLTIPILLVLLLIQNAAALVFPAWASLGPERASGFEVLGQRLVWMFGTFLGAGLMVLPAGMAGGATFFVLSHIFGNIAWIPAALTTAVALFAEAAVVILWLGRVFERLDPSSTGFA